jgi:hypothetical protein
MVKPSPEELLGNPKSWDDGPNITYLAVFVVVIKKLLGIY